MRISHIWLTLLALSVFASSAFAQTMVVQDVQSLPLPVVEETFLPSWYYSFDFALVQPRLKGMSSLDGSPTFSSNQDWTVMPRFEIGFLNRGPWNFYFGYQGLYSDSNQGLYDAPSDTFYSYFQSVEVNAFDFGVLSETFPVLAVIRAQWDLSARLTITDFQSRYGLDFISTVPSYIVGRAQQQFIGAGPRAGLRMELPFSDTGLALTGRIDAGVQWGSYHATACVQSRIDGVYSEDGASSNEGGVIWHAGGQLALRYNPPRYADRLSFYAGYMYQAWFSKTVSLMDGVDYGRLEYQGPFFGMEWKY